MNNGTSLLLMAVLVAFSAYFSATETAFSSLNRTRLRVLAEKGDKRAALACSLSYDPLSQLERLDSGLSLAALEGDWWGRDETLGDLLEQRRDAARAECADWHTWSLSACLAAG